MKVEELKQYGQTLSGIPREAMKKQESIVMREIRNKFGITGILPFFIRLQLEQRRLKRKYPEAYQATVKVGESAAKELPMLNRLFSRCVTKLCRIF